jgi:hypothetical protein
VEFTAALVVEFSSGGGFLLNSTVALVMRINSRVDLGTGGGHRCGGGFHLFRLD